MVSTFQISILHLMVHVSMILWLLVMRPTVVGGPAVDIRGQLTLFRARTSIRGALGTFHIM